MSTRSRIAIKVDDNKYKHIYSHWDGYPEHHVPILKNNYNTEKKVEKLIRLGNISELKESRKETVSYHKWRKEGRNIKITSYDDLLKNLGIVNFIYIFEDGQWSYVSCLNRNKIAF